MDGYSKKVAVEEFGRRSSAYAACSTLMNQKDLDTVAELLNLKGNEWVLDVATGTGYLAMTLSFHVNEVIGLDITPQMLKIAKKAARERGIENITYHVGDAECLPFRDSQFDAVTCRFSLHHFPSPALSLSEMVRVLRPGGRIIIEDMVSSEEPDKSTYQNMMEHLRDPSHIRHYQISEMEAMMRNTGLNIVDKVSRCSDFVFDHWIEMASPPVETVENIREMMIASMEGDKSGLNVRIVDNKIMFTYSTVIIMADKRDVLSGF